MAPFECDFCIFHKLKFRNPCLDNPWDCSLLAVIRRANLDAFWSTAPSTVRENTRRLKVAQKFSEKLKLPGPYRQAGPFPQYDYCGYEVAFQMLLYSLNSGKINKKHTQWNTIRQLRAAYSNQVKSSSQSNQVILSLNDTAGNYQRFNKDPCGSLWFKKFIEGCHNRMGDESMTNRAFSIHLLKAIVHKTEEKLELQLGRNLKHLWLVFSCYTVICYVVSLRGNEAFLVDLDGILRHWNERREKNYFIIALRGKIKGEKHDIAHLLPCSNTTSSGLPIKDIVGRLIRSKKDIRFTDGPLMSNMNGEVLTPKAIDDMLIQVLSEIYTTSASLFPVDIQRKIKDKEGEAIPVLKLFYSCFRSYRRTSNTRALEFRNKVFGEDIEIVNKWRAKERARGKQPANKMKLHYAEVEVLLRPFLRYTEAM